MAQKKLDIEPFGEVTLNRRRGQKSISLRVASNGSVKVTHPWFVTQSMALAFITTKKDWILRQQIKFRHDWADNHLVTPDMRLELVQSDSGKPSKKVLSEGQLQVRIPSSYSHKQSKIYIDKAVTSEQKSYVESNYLPFLSELAQENGFTYKSARVKSLKARWGSCDQNKEIVLNTYLARLPYDLVEYVLVHELVHTQHLNHSPSFWRRLEQILPDYKERRKQLRDFQPAPGPCSVS